MAWHDFNFMKSDIRELINKPIKSVDFELFIFYPNDGLQSNYPHGILSMWEGDILPTPWITGLNRFEHVFAPSEFVAKVFRDSGITSNIYVLPLGIDTQLYKTKKRTFPQNRPFRFFTLGKMEPRKNVECLVNAFQNEFQTGDVELWIKTRERFLPESVKIAAMNDKRIKIIEKTLTEDGLLKLYLETDAFIYCSRSEGFAFTPRNAISTGMPTAVTDYSALAEIEGAVKIPIKGLSPMPACGFSFNEEKSILMADINPKTVGKIMSDIYTRYDGYVKWTLDNRNPPSWENTARVFVDIIKEII